MEKLKDLVQIISNLIDLAFTGSIEIHFNQGSICRV